MGYSNIVCHSSVTEHVLSTGRNKPTKCSSSAGQMSVQWDWCRPKSVEIVWKTRHLKLIAFRHSRHSLPNDDLKSVCLNIFQAESTLIANPGSFDDIMKPLTDSLTTAISNEKTLISIAEEIFRQVLKICLVFLSPR